LPTVTLHDKTALEKVTSSAIFKRLTDHQDSIVAYVLDLGIGPLADEQWFYFEILPSLQDMIRNFSNLQYITWLTHHGTGTGYGHYSAGRDSSTLFHKMHPSARLDVVYRNRQYTPINRALLSSPQLQALDISVCYNNNNNNNNNNGPALGINEHETLKQCLIEGNIVNVLRLGFERVWLPHKYSENDSWVLFQDWKSVTIGSLNFHWQNSDRFPALEKFKIQYCRYEFTPENCNM
jgi:hypothetical protein